MGHIRLGRLGTSPSWQALIAQLDLAAVDVHAVALSTADGAQVRLSGMRDDPVLGYCIWLLSRLATAARADDFQEQARHLGLAIVPGETAFSLIGQVNTLVMAEVNRHPASGPFGEIAATAVKRTLLETIVSQQRTLLDSTVEDLGEVVRRQTTNRAFGDLTARFFGDVLARTLRFYVDKELPFHIGAESGFSTIETTRAFLVDLDRYSRQSARIVETFAADWLSKHAYLEQGMISRDQAQAFAAHALRKLDGALRMEAVA
ncbi:MAG: hypothetical protein QM753_13220 [Thermomicrobiales bacterium]